MKGVAESTREVTYIAIGGPIGAGKTTLANALATCLGGRVVAEAVAEHPFIEQFYRDKERYALLTQLAFLVSREQQQLEIAHLRRKGLVVADYVVEKDAIFARLNLKPEEFGVYQLLRHFIMLEGPDPDVVVYLKATPDVLAEHIRNRGRDYEKRIRPDYLGTISEEYERTFSRYTRAPILVQDVSEIRFQDGAGVSEFAERLRRFCDKLDLALP